MRSQMAVPTVMAPGAAPSSVYPSGADFATVSGHAAAPATKLRKSRRFMSTPSLRHPRSYWSVRYPERGKAAARCAQVGPYGHPRAAVPQYGRAITWRNDHEKAQYAWDRRWCRVIGCGALLASMVPRECGPCGATANVVTC